MVHLDVEEVDANVGKTCIRSSSSSTCCRLLLLLLLGWRIGTPSCCWWRLRTSTNQLLHQLLHDSP
jgi:hypothetical protein